VHVAIVPLLVLMLMLVLVLMLMLMLMAFVHGGARGSCFVAKYLF